jgi:NADH-quinone oxidoreductase subunit J
MSGLAALLTVIIFAAPIVSENLVSAYPIQEGVGNPQAIGMVLFTKYLVPFEVAAVMLLVAMIAGIVLAGKKMDRSLTLMRDEDIAAMEEVNEKAVS